MFTITTTYKSNDNGTGVILAKGAGRQKTTKVDHSLTTEAKHGAAAGALLNVLLDDRQKGMLRHPSGGQRVRREVTGETGGKTVWTISV